MAIKDYPFHIVKDPTTITASIIGLALTPTLDGEALSSQDDAFGPWVEHRTQVALNPAAATSCGLLTSFDVVAAGWLPQVEMRIWTPGGTGATDDLLLWAGMFSGRPDAIADPVNLNVAAFRFQSSVPGKWEGVVNNGGVLPQIIPMGNNTFAGGQKYSLKIKVNDTSVEFTIDNAPPVTLPNFVPNATVPMGLAIRATRLAAAATAKRIRWQRVSWTYPG
jgi:hypothetical protein